MKWVLIGIGVVVVLVVLVVVVGYSLPKGHRASSRARYAASVESVWSTISDYERFAEWHPEVKSVERGADVEGAPVWVLKTGHGPMPLALTEVSPPKRLVTRIADDRLPFGGTWTWEVLADGEETRLTITENGEIYNPVFRFLAKTVFGYHATMDGYLTAIGKKLGDEVSPEHVS
jgi:uncharacterized protein YndB with AHSA1/START domain